MGFFWREDEGSRVKKEDKVNEEGAGGDEWWVTGGGRVFCDWIDI